MSRASQRARGNRQQLSPRQMREQAQNAPERTHVSDDFSPIEIDATGTAPADDRIPFMSILEPDPTSSNGATRKREFTIPREVPPNAVIRYMENVRFDGTEIAMAELMADMLGDDAMSALAKCEHVTKADMKQIMAIIEDKALGAFEDYQGNS